MSTRTHSLRLDEIFQFLMPAGKGTGLPRIHESSDDSAPMRQEQHRHAGRAIGLHIRQPVRSGPKDGRRATFSSFPGNFLRVLSV